MRRLLLTVLLLCATPALAAETIEGRWLTPKGQTISIAACHQGFCLTRETGQPLGSVAGAGDRYEGQLVNPENGKANAAKIEFKGDALTVSGCVGPICASRTWTRVTP